MLLDHTPSENSAGYDVMRSGWDVICLCGADVFVADEELASKGKFAALAEAFLDHYAALSASGRLWDADATSA